jgi:hypothetical protein
MTVIVSVRINDGIVLAADSAGSLDSGQVYAHANKIANLCSGLPIGAMSTGSGGIGNESIETLLKDLRRRFSGLEPTHAEWRLDPERYTMGQVSERLRSFLFEEKAAACPDPTSLQMRLCGYSAGRPLTEVGKSIWRRVPVCRRARSWMRTALVYYGRTVRGPEPINSGARL